MTGANVESQRDQPVVAKTVVNAMTVDVEEYFQVSAFSGLIDPNDWPDLPSRIEANMDRLLALLEEHGARCTFFTLGWIAERHKSVVRKIIDSGHELASHGYGHVRASAQNSDQFRSDIRRTKNILEDVGGVAVNGYRAASFSFDTTNPWAHTVLAEEGYHYSSSIYPIRHDHYGVPDAPRFTYAPVGKNGAIEFPLTTVKLLGRNFPCAGGGYFRLLPYKFSHWAVKKVNEEDQHPTIFYFHPWEIDPNQPRLCDPGIKTRFRHYVNLSAMEGKLSRLLSDFSWDRMDRVFECHDGSDSA